MNKDEVKNLAAVGVMILGPLVAKYGVDASTLMQLLTSAIGAGAAVYMHWNMVKVHEDSVSDDGEA